jgi:hypothetical protein
MRHIYLFSSLLDKRSYIGMNFGIKENSVYQANVSDFRMSKRDLMLVDYRI